MKSKKHAVNRKAKPKIDEITLVAIVAIIAIIIVIYHKSSTSQGQELAAMILEEKTLLFTNDGIINENELMKIKNMDYEQLKKSLNVKDDFCIYLEDENGVIIVAKGSEKLSSDFIHCK